jgi:ribosome biogenesis GTPase / thiamine phosphate phosphatase
MLTGVVLARAAAVFRVHTVEGEVTAVLRGRLKLADDDRCVAGDVVDLKRHGDGPATVERVHTRRSVLARRRAGGARRAQPIAANVDQVVVVAAARDPETIPRMLDRFLVVAEANGLPAAVVVNKADLDPSVVATIGRRFARAGYLVVGTSAKTGDGLPALRDLLRGRETVLTGASGVGKSSLLNTLQPGLKLRIGAISEKWRTGTHTTRAAELVPLDAGGFVVDTPGMREVGAWGIAPHELGACFPEFRPYLDRCRFDDCRHLVEPGCAVRSAVEAAVVDPDRLLSYERLYTELSVPSWSSARHRGS